MTAPNAEPESEICSRCGEGTGWEWIEGEGFLSVCCSRPPMRLDCEPLDAA